MSGPGPSGPPVDDERHPSVVSFSDVPYRASHTGSDKAADYDRDFWTPGSAKAQNWVLERRLLDRAFAEVLRGEPQRALDFACGTGRVLAELEPRVGQAVGVDVSADMLAIARARCGRSTLLCADVTDPTAVTPELDAPFDLITSFRFFLNAEPGLRRSVLAWIRAHLGPNGHLVANFHLNPNSLRGAYLRARWRGEHRVPMLSPRQVTELLRDAGLRVVDLQGYEYLPYRRDGAALGLSVARARIEGALLGRTLLRPVAGCHLVVARPA